MVDSVYTVDGRLRVKTLGAVDAVYESQSPVDAVNSATRYFFVVALGTCLLRPWRKSVRPLAQRAALDVGPRKRCCVTTARVRFQAHSADGRVLSRKRRASSLAMVRGCAGFPRYSF